MFNKWAEIMLNTLPRDPLKPVNLSTDHLLDLRERAQKSITRETIQTFIANEESFQHGELLLDTLENTTYDLDATTATIYSKSEAFHIKIEFNSNGSIEKARCECSMERCKHCAATLFCFMKYPERFSLVSPIHIGSPSFESDSSYSSSFKKRCLDPTLGDNTENESDSKRSRSSQDDSVCRIKPYKLDVSKC